MSKRPHSDEPEVTEEQPHRSYTREGLEEAGAGFLQALGDGLGALMDRAGSEIETVARTSKAKYDLIQAQRDRDTLFRKLGREVYQLALEGELDHPQLTHAIDKLREAHDRIAELDDEPEPTPAEE